LNLDETLPNLRVLEINSSLWMLDQLLILFDHLPRLERLLLHKKESYNGWIEWRNSELESSCKTRVPMVVVEWLA